MKEQLRSRGIRLVAISKDDVDAAAMHKRRDELTLTLLTDPDLRVIRQYGVEHHKSIQFSGGGIKLFALPIGLVPSFKAMAIPTTLLVDEHGTIRWIDQTDDYRLRSSEARVLEAIDQAFPND